MAEEIRVLTTGELDAYVNLGAQAFQIDAAGAERWRKSVDPGTVRGLFVAGRMCAALTLLDMRMWLGPGTVRTGGLAGVACPPEHRRMGYTDRILRAALAEMRARDMPLSALYPFYFPFYNRYGWAQASENHELTIPIERLPLVQPRGTWHPVFIATNSPLPPGEEPIAEADLAVLMGIYDGWAAARVGPLVRDAAWWRHRKVGSGRNTFYWRDPMGAPRAYVTYAFKETGPWARRLEVRELIALDTDALRAALAFLRNHDSQAKEVSLVQPEDSRLLVLLDDPRVPVTVDAGFMLRLVDVPAALMARRYPAGAIGRLVLEVAEGWTTRAPQRYALDARDGVAAVTPSSAMPGLSLDQRTLAQLYCGYLTPPRAAELGLLEVHDAAALMFAAALFAGPRPFLPDFF